MKKAMASTKEYAKYKKDVKDKEKEMSRIRKEVIETKQQNAFLM